MKVNKGAGREWGIPESSITFPRCQINEDLKLTVDDRFKFLSFSFYIVADKAKSVSGHIIRILLRTYYIKPN